MQIEVQQYQSAGNGTEMGAARVRRLAVSGTNGLFSSSGTTHCRAQKNSESLQKFSPMRKANEELPSSGLHLVNNLDLSSPLI